MRKGKTKERRQGEHPKSEVVVHDAVIVNTPKPKKMVKAGK